MAYIEEEAEHFKHFLEDDEPWDDYLARLRDDGGAPQRRLKKEETRTLSLSLERERERASERYRGRGWLEGSNACLGGS